MERILICPGERPAVGFLAQTVPLVTAPILGESLLTCWLESLVSTGVREVLILVTDRPELVRSALGDGSRWGLRAKVEVELTELTPDEVRGRIREDKFRVGPAFNPSDDVILLNHLPGRPDLRLFRSYQDWFGALLGWMLASATPRRIGVRELDSGIWCGRRTQVSASAKLIGPCWLGDQVRVGGDAVIGPNAILEDRVVVDAAAEVQSSFVGPDTFVGTLTRIEGSIAWGNTLIDWRSGSCTQVPDPFLLCALGQRYLPEGPGRKDGVPPRSLWRRLLKPWEMLAQIPRKLRF